MRLDDNWSDTAGLCSPPQLPRRSLDRGMSMTTKAFDSSPRTTARPHRQPRHSAHRLCDPFCGGVRDRKHTFALILSPVRFLRLITTSTGRLQARSYGGRRWGSGYGRVGRQVEIARIRHDANRL